MRKPLQEVEMKLFALLVIALSLAAPGCENKPPTPKVAAEQHHG
jgi:hypothetical protein